MSFRVVLDFLNQFSNSHEVRMVGTSRPNTRPLEGVVGGGESSNERARSLAGMLLFDENDTSDWQDSLGGAIDRGT